MTTLREAAQQALEAYDKHEPLAFVMEALRAALAEPTVKESLQVPGQRFSCCEKCRE